MRIFANKRIEKLFASILLLITICFLISAALIRVMSVRRRVAAATLFFRLAHYNERTWRIRARPTLARLGSEFFKE